MNSLQRSTTPESQPCGLPVARASNSTSLGESWATLTHLLAKIDAASVFANKWVSVAQLSPRLVELEARATGKPHGWDSGVVERCSEFIEAGDAFATLRNEVVDRYIENEIGR